MNVKINSELQETKQQTVTFSDQNQQWLSEVQSKQDDAFATADTSDALLEDFFKRPIRITTLDWDVGNSLPFTTINPWQAFFENPRIENRITNFKNLRCNLKVKLVINGNGFHYGRALASYRPLHTEDEYPVWRTLVPNSVVSASQRMHVWLDPTKSQGGTMSLPFVWNRNTLSIPDEDWRSMGEIDIGSLTTLEHANGGTDQVAISIFVWAEDVVLSMPTSTSPGSLTPQAGPMDEYDGAKPISGPATALAKVAGTLENIPGIAPYATATKTAANAVSGVAGALGLSRPVDDSGIATYKPAYAGNMANTNVVDTSNKLSFDVKQEVTIDPSAVGMGNDDEMNLSSITQRESYLTQFNWAREDNADEILWSSYVTPLLFASSGTSPNEIFATPMCYASMAFKQWRGTIRYRFQIVASQFHKGRIKVVYDPHFNTTSEYNIQYTQVIDLANSRDFTVDIGWGQPFSFLDVPTFSTSISWYDNGSLGGERIRDCNGTISVYSVNSLTSPSDSNDPVQILVSVSSGPDFELVNPTADNLDLCTFYAPSAGGLTLAGEPSSSDTFPEYSRLKDEPSQWLATEPFPGTIGEVLYLPSGKTKPWPREDDLDFQFGEMKRYCDCKGELVNIGNVDVCWNCYKCYVYDSDESFDFQAGELDNADNDLTTNDTAPISMDTKASMGVKQKQDHTYLVYYGDPIDNLRCLLKRYNGHSSWIYQGLAGESSAMTRYTISDFPFNRGYAGSEAMHLASQPVDPTPYNYSRMTTMNWFTPLYLTRRGGIRWKYIRQDDQDVNGIMTVNRSTSNTTLGKVQAAIAFGQNSERVRNALNVLPDDHTAGHHATHTAHNPALEIELPFLTNFRFIPARRRGWKLQSDYLRQHTLQIPGGTDASSAFVTAYCAAGEDYSLAWFQAVPSFWRGTTPLPSSASI